MSGLQGPWPRSGWIVAGWVYGAGVYLNLPLGPRAVVEYTLPAARAAPR